MMNDLKSMLSKREDFIAYGGNKADRDIDLFERLGSIDKIQRGKEEASP